jgi:tetratricopeptide (TPR) repeat protein
MELSSGLLHYGKTALLALVLLYSLLAGLRTVTDPDTGWQLASGRYILQHHQIPSTDVLSYTARGREWIYPPLAEIVLYGLYALGGFAALSWLSSLGCAATVSCAFYAESSLAAIALATLAVPRIAYRTAPRADLFSTVLFAALLALLWRHFRGRHAPLWLVPVIMLIWVNAHPGFIAGLALLALYLALELLDLPFAGRGAAAAERLRGAAPWLLVAIPVTLLNRWGWKIYAGVFQQEQALGVHENVIAEWRRTPISLDTVSQALDWRNPNSGFWWLLAAAVVAAIVALKRRQFGSAALLLGCSYLALHNLRFQGLFGVVAIVVAAPYFSGWFDLPAAVKLRARRDRRERISEKSRFNPSRATAFILLGCTFLVGIRAYDLISERAYIAAGEPALFGTGLSSWYPERAAEFVMRERLPGNIFHEYNMGGYFAFSLGPQYPDYVDGRAIPFEDVMFEQRKIMRQSPDSADWQQEADQRGINTLVFSLARYWGLGSTHVQQFCASRGWKPVYLDEEAAVFVRNVPENAVLLNRLQIDCRTMKFDPSPALAADTSLRGRAELFNFYANSGSILYNLGRNAEAAANLDHALQMFPEEPYLHHTRGQLYEASRQFQDAEREYLLSAHLEPTEANWYSLGMLYSSQRRYAEAVKAVRHAADISVRPSEYYTLLARLYLASNQSQDALEALDLAIEQSDHEPPDIKPAIEEQVAEERAQVWSKMGDLQRAVGFQQQALTYKPSNPQLWTTLADLYAASGQGQLEQQARQRAQELSQPGR